MISQTSKHVFMHYVLLKITVYLADFVMVQFAKTALLPQGGQQDPDPFTSQDLGNNRSHVTHHTMFIVPPSPLCIDCCVRFPHPRNLSDMQNIHSETSPNYNRNVAAYERNHRIPVIGTSEHRHRRWDEVNSPLLTNQQIANITTVYGCVYREVNRQRTIILIAAKTGRSVQSGKDASARNLLALLNDTRPVVNQSGVQKEHICTTNACHPSHGHPFSDHKH